MGKQDGTQEKAEMKNKEKEKYNLDQRSSRQKNRGGLQAAPINRLRVQGGPFGFPALLFINVIRATNPYRNKGIVE
jgi:hypothetical protein